MRELMELSPSPTMPSESLLHYTEHMPLFEAFLRPAHPGPPKIYVWNNIHRRTQQSAKRTSTLSHVLYANTLCSCLGPVADPARRKTLGRHGAKGGGGGGEVGPAARRGGEEQEEQVRHAIQHDQSQVHVVIV